MERPTLRQLEYAVAVADHRHFGRAAEAANVTQPGLSGQIGQLERRLGVRLFERSGRQVALTSAGAEIVERARRLLRDADDLAVAASLHRGTVRGLLRVAAIPTMAPYLLPALTAVARQSWPEARLELQELQSEPMVAAVGGGAVDLGLLAVPYDTGPLHAEPVADEPFCLAVPDGHRLASADSLPLGVLTDLPVLLLPDGHCLRDHALDACEIAGRVEHSEVRAASLSTLAQMVVGGAGVTLLPAGAVAVEARPGSGIAARPFEPPAPGRGIALVWRPTDPRSELFAALAAELAPRVEALVGSGEVDSAG